MNGNLEQLQQIFLGEAIGEVNAELLAMRDPATRSYDPPADVQLSYARDGFLLVSSQELSNRRDELSTWSDGTVFSSERFAFFPWESVTNVEVDQPPGREDVTDLKFFGELPFAATLRLSVSDADELWSYATDWEGLRTRRGDETWHSLVADIATVLADSPYITDSEIVEQLESDHDWESVSIDQVIEILWEPWFQANAITNLWFYAFEAEAEYQGGDDFADHVLDLLRQNPHTADALLESILEQGEFESTEIEDVYDVLYSQQMPTFKRLLAWFSTVDEEESI